MPFGKNLFLRNNATHKLRDSELFSMRRAGAGNSATPNFFDAHSSPADHASIMLPEELIPTLFSTNAFAIATQWLQMESKIFQNFINMRSYQSTQSFLTKRVLQPKSCSRCPCGLQCGSININRLGWRDAFGSVASHWNG